MLKKLNGHNLSGKISSGIRTPSNYELFSIYGNTNLKNEKNVSFEIKDEWTKYSLSFLLNIQRHNQLINFNPPKQRYENKANNTIFGVGVMGKLNIGEGVNYGISYSAIGDNRSQEIGHAPFKAYLRSALSISNMRLNFSEVFYTSRLNYDLSETPAQMISQVTLKYQSREKLELELQAANQLSFDNKSLVKRFRDSQNIIKLSLKGSI